MNINKNSLNINNIIIKLSKLKFESQYKTENQRISESISETASA